MKLFVKEVAVRGFYLWEVVDESGRAIATAWSRAGAIAAAKVCLSRSSKYLPAPRPTRSVALQKKFRCQQT